MIGSVLGRALEARGLPFTWSDTEEPAAWQASTGRVTDAAGAAAWGYILARVPALWASVEPAPQFKWSSGEWRAEPDTYMVAVPHLVAWTRHDLNLRRVDAPPAGARVIVAHGFNDRRASYSRGWSMAVQAVVPHGRAAYSYHTPRVKGLSYRTGAARYLYPIAGDPGWYWAGSEMRTVQSRASWDAEPDYTDWLHAMEAVGITVVTREIGPPRLGWRPMAAPGDGLKGVGADWLPRSDGALLAPPLYHSGVTRAPGLIADLLNLLEID